MPFPLIVLAALVIGALIFYLAYWAGHDDGARLERDLARGNELHFYQMGVRHGVAQSKRKRDAHGRYIKVK